LKIKENKKEKQYSPEEHFLEIAECCWANPFGRGGPEFLQAGSPKNKDKK